MAREMQAEDARNSLVYFTDERDGKKVRGFGIDMGPGLPKNTRRVFLSFYYDGSVQEEVILLDENDPLVVIQKISFADFIVRVSHILDYARRERLMLYAILIPDLPRDVSLSEIDFDKDAVGIKARVPEHSIFHSVELFNVMIAELAEKGITEI